MAEELRTIPDLLCQVGDELANHGESLLVLQQGCHGEANGTRSGWVSSSAAALAGLLDRWATASAAHMGRFGEHCCGMHFAAVGFAEMERRHTAALAEAGGESRSAR